MQLTLEHYLLSAPPYAHSCASVPRCRLFQSAPALLRPRRRNVRPLHHNIAWRGQELGPLWILAVRAGLVWNTGDDGARPDSYPHTPAVGEVAKAQARTAAVDRIDQVALRVVDALLSDFILDWLAGIRVLNACSCGVLAQVDAFHPHAIGPVVHPEHFALANPRLTSVYHHLVPRVDAPAVVGQRDSRLAAEPTQSVAFRALRVPVRGARGGGADGALKLFALSRRPCCNLTNTALCL
mgnify:CR=1 FL=1